MTDLTSEQKTYNRKVEGIKRYAAGDTSDPFTLARCMTHLRTGITNMRFNEATGEPRDCDYTATISQERRTLADGTEYTVPIWINRVKP